MKSEIELLKQGKEIEVNAKKYAQIHAYCDNVGIELVVSKAKNLVKIKLK